MMTIVLSIFLIFLGNSIFFYTFFMHIKTQEKQTLDFLTDINNQINLLKNSIDINNNLIINLKEQINNIKKENKELMLKEEKKFLIEDERIINTSKNILEHNKNKLENDIKNVFNKNIIDLIIQKFETILWKD